MIAPSLHVGGVPGGVRTYKSNTTTPSITAIPTNHRFRRSEFLKGAQGVDLVEAAIHAERIGLPVNYYITINFAAARVMRRAQEIVGHYLRLIGQWLSKRGVQITFLWVLEHYIGTGEHVHILLHCPPELARKFAAKARSHWLTVVGGTPRCGAFSCERFGLFPRDDHLDVAQYRKRLKGLLRYLLKTLDPSEASYLEGYLPKRLRRSTAELFKVRTKRHLPIEGRRCSRSENISKTARERWLDRSTKCPVG